MSLAISRTHGAVLLSSMLLAAPACGPSLANVQSAYEADPNRKPFDDKACPMSLQLKNADSDGVVRMISEEACVRLAGDTIALPTDIKIWVNEIGAWDHYGVCHEKGIETKGDVTSCTWNRFFRHSWPWTVTLRSKRAGHSLKSQLKAVRVFRNGDLVWSWVPQPDASVLSELTIPGRELKERLMPEGAPLDIRIVPAGVAVDEAVLLAKVQERPRQWEVQLKAATDAFLSSPSIAEGTLKKQIDCIHYRAKMLVFHASSIAGSPSVEPTSPDLTKCPKPGQSGSFASLKERYDELKAKGSGAVDELEKKFIDEVQKFRSETSAREREALGEFKKQAQAFWEGKGGPGGEWWRALEDAGNANGQGDRERYIEIMDRYPEARRAILDGRIDAIWGMKPTIQVANLPKNAPLPAEVKWLQTRGSLVELNAILSQTEAMITQGLRAIDDTIALQVELRKDVVRIANSADEQARLFLHVANGLQGTSPFLQLQSNPELLPGERALGMEYSDKFQWFAIAPWTGFPVGLDGEADFTGANLIPLIDFVGWRYQFARTRFSDVRVGFGFTALSFTVDAKQSGSDAASTVQEEQRKLRISPEANVGFGTFKLGVAYALGEGLSYRERVRIMVGADLYKLITGENLEAL